MRRSTGAHPDHACRQPAAAGALDQPFVRRAGGESVGPDEIAAAGRAALRAIVPKQAEAGIDVGNNGEQQRESFFLYLKERLTGLGGTWQRPSRADVDRYPEFKQRWLEQTVEPRRACRRTKACRWRSARCATSMPAAIEAECRDFARCPRRSIRTLSSRPS